MKNKSNKKRHLTWITDGNIIVGDEIFEFKNKEYEKKLGRIKKEKGNYIDYQKAEIEETEKIIDRMTKLVRKIKTTQSNELLKPKSKRITNPHQFEHDQLNNQLLKLLAVRFHNDEE